VARAYAGLQIMIIIPEIDAAAFSVQAPRPPPGYPAYWYVKCRRCGLSWYLPRDPARRTKEALSILHNHATQHEARP
jgi:hypothetical protein